METNTNRQSRWTTSLSHYMPHASSNNHTSILVAKTAILLPELVVGIFVIAAVLAHDSLSHDIVELDFLAQSNSVSLCLSQDTQHFPYLSFGPETTHNSPSSNTSAGLSSCLCQFLTTLATSSTAQEPIFSIFSLFLSTLTYCRACKVLSTGDISNRFQRSSSIQHSDPMRACLHARAKQAYFKHWRC